LLALALPAIALAAPTKKEKQEIERIVNNSGQSLGWTMECERPDLGNRYLDTLKDTLAIYPGTDPIKVRALLRQVEREAEAVSKLGYIPEPTQEDIDRKAMICERQMKIVQNEMRTMDAFILK
jgi:hypothetical protein